MSAGRAGVLVAAVLAACEPAEPDQSGRKGGIEVVGGFAYANAGKTAAAYLSLSNRGKVEDTLLAMSSILADSVTLHESVSQGGMVTMTQVEHLVLPEGMSTEMAPGGLHLMLSGLKVSLVAGRKLPLVLEFARAGRLELELPINSYGERQ